MKTIISFLKIYEDLLLERVGVGRQQSSSTSCYSPSGWITIYVFGKSLHQQKYKVLQKGFEAGLSKQQISNVFANQEALRVANISPLTAIVKKSLIADWLCLDVIYPIHKDGVGSDPDNHIPYL